MNAVDIMAMYETHAQLKHYVPIIRDEPRYPLIVDCHDRVLSMPPIINGELTRLHQESTNILIDVTATDATRGEIVLNTIVSAFAAYCTKPHTVETVTVTYDSNHPQRGGKVVVLPDVTPQRFEAELAYLSRCIGLESLDATLAQKLLKRMMIDSRPLPDGRIEALVPIARSDILHPCDLAEDIAIAYGYNNLPVTESDATVPLNRAELSDQVRTLLAGAGFHGAKNFALHSHAENFEMLNHPEPSDHEDGAIYEPFGHPVVLANPKSREFEIVRTTLISGLLKALVHNQSRPLPLKMFEIGDCVVQHAPAATGCRNRIHVAALFAGWEAGLEEVHGLLDLLMIRLQVSPVYPDSPAPRYPRTYELVPCEDPMFLKGRGAALVLQPGNRRIGLLGTVSPVALRRWRLPLPCSIFELCLEPCLEWADPLDVLL